MSITNLHASATLDYNQFHQQLMRMEKDVGRQQNVMRGLNKELAILERTSGKGSQNFQNLRGVTANASFAIQDFTTVLAGGGGLNFALIAASNNLSQIAISLGGPVTAGISATVIALAALTPALFNMGRGAKSARKEWELLNDQISKTNRNNDFTMRFAGERNQAGVASLIPPNADPRFAREQGRLDRLINQAGDSPESQRLSELQSTRQRLRSELDDLAQNIKESNIDLREARARITDTERSMRTIRQDAFVRAVGRGLENSLPNIRRSGFSGTSGGGGEALFTSSDRDMIRRMFGNSPFQNVNEAVRIAETVAQRNRQTLTEDQLADIEDAIRSEVARVSNAFNDISAIANGTAPYTGGTRDVSDPNKHTQAQREFFELAKRLREEKQSEFEITQRLVDLAEKRNLITKEEAKTLREMNREREKLQNQIIGEQNRKDRIHAEETQINALQRARQLNAETTPGLEGNIARGALGLEQRISEIRNLPGIDRGTKSRLINQSLTSFRNNLGASINQGGPRTVGAFEANSLQTQSLINRQFIGSQQQNATERLLDQILSSSQSLAETMVEIRENVRGLKDINFGIIGNN